MTTSLTELELGERLNTVRHAQCGRRGQRGPMTVHTHAVRWVCGHTLPRLPVQRFGKATP